MNCPACGCPVVLARGERGLVKIDAAPDPDGIVLLAGGREASSVPEARFLGGLEIRDRQARYPDAPGLHNVHDCG